MSTVSEILKAVRQVMLIENRVDHLSASVTKLSRDTDHLATGLKDLAVKVARIEGFIQGRSSAPAANLLPGRSE